VDVFSREALAIEVGKRLRAEDVVSVLNRLVAQRRKRELTRTTADQ
jgi:putative transposase